MTAGPRGPVLMEDYQLLEKLAHQNRERIPERTVHAKGWGAFGTLTITHDITGAAAADSGDAARYNHRIGNASLRSSTRCIPTTASACAPP